MLNLKLKICKIYVNIDAAVELFYGCIYVLYLKFLRRLFKTFLKYLNTIGFFQPFIIIVEF